ncbi:integrin alpha-E-like [Erinaceus europaeus]|uniref:Integrin alpha-E-like n=1 Tax=Erinaceus europaeus TaxID=9365 RepID=A0ABM3YII5_ERIEU|nr:integrin alpha-E-like [Erinaceus europaeus]
MLGTRQPVQTQTPRDFLRAPTEYGFLKGSREWLSLQATTVCTRRDEDSCGSEPVQHVDKWHSVTCTIAADKENVTVAAELSPNGLKQLQTEVTELQILAEISFNRSLYEGLNAENHRTKIFVIFLPGDVLLPLPLIIGSSVGGFLVLILIIVILFKCGFFKRRYQQLNLDSIRKNQLELDNLYKDNEKDELPRPVEESISQPSHL